MALAIVIFAGALALIASERFDRTKIALLGAVLVLLTQTLEQEQAIESIDFNTIGLLAGMMVLVRLTETTGVYTWLAIRAGQVSRGRPLAVVTSLAVTTAVLSAFLDNLTTVLLMVPITFLLADALDIDPIPLVIIEVIASNIGGTATLIGDPPNIIIAGATDLSFMAFINNLAPIAAVSFVVVIGLLYLAYRPRLQIAPEARRRVMELDADRSIENRDELHPHPSRAGGHDRAVLPTQGARSGAGHRRIGGRHGRATGNPPVPHRSARRDRVANAVLLHRPVRDGGRPRRDRCDRRGC